MPLTRLLIPTFTQMIETLSSLLDKAKSQLPEDEREAILSAQLAPDMYPLSSQIRSACIQALEAVYRLQGEPLPSSVFAAAEKVQGGSSGAPASISDAKKLIEETIAVLANVAPNAFDNRAEIPITLELSNGVVFNLTGEQYARDWSLPQFYFHIVTAYAILRHAGVDIGKIDYVSHMLKYIRPNPPS